MCDNQGTRFAKTLARGLAARALTNGEKILVERHSSFNAILVTEDDAGLRTLRFGRDGICQSIVKPGFPAHLELPYARVLPACVALVPQLRRMLIVGLGGGTLAMFFHRLFPEVKIDVVEIDRAVLEVATSHCGFSQNLHVHVSIEDGRDFIEARRDLYDLIVLDGFDAATIPRHLATLEFLNSVRAALTTDGIAVANIWGRGRNRLFADMLCTFREAFADLYVLDVPGPKTKVFCALQTKQEITREELLARASEISRRCGLGVDLGESITGFRNAREEHFHAGSVLRDSR